MPVVPFNRVELSINPAEAGKTGSKRRNGAFNLDSDSVILLRVAVSTAMSNKGVVLHRALPRPIASPSTWRSPSSQGRSRAREMEKGSFEPTSRPDQG
jgi:hypothetical protein